MARSFAAPLTKQLRMLSASWGRGRAEPELESDAPSNVDADAAKDADETREESPEAEIGREYMALWPNVRVHVAFVGALSAAINLLYLAPSLFMLQVYDRVIPTSGVLTLAFLSVVLLLSLGVMALLDALRTRIMTRTALRIERVYTPLVIRHAMNARRSAVQPMASIRDLDALRQGVTSPAASGLLDSPWTPLFIAVCFIIHFWIGVLALSGAIIIFALALVNERVTRNALLDLNAKTAQFYVSHEADLRIAGTIQALGAESAMLRRRAEARNALNAAQSEAAFRGGDLSAITKAARLVLQSAALGLGAILAVMHEISPGAIIAATILTARAFAPVEQVVGGWRQLGLAFAGYRNLSRLVNSETAKDDRTPLPAPAPRVAVENVSATTPDGSALVLQNVSFSAQPGEIVAVIGPSGAGKSTLARILANAASPRSGAVRIDGGRYADWNAETLSAHIGYLPQGVDLFDGTIAENIARLSQHAADSEEDVGPKVVAAAQAAGAHQMILRLPKAYETKLGDSGSGLSHGQSQRIALARALYNDPAVLVLDEPNTHLDAEGEEALLAAMQRAKRRNALVFVVAHRAGVINACDKIAVIRDGRLVEFGERDAVLQKLNAHRNATTPLAALQGGAS
ncbi:MAG: type I secretion system permease/ATPase [Alphaproteobacteria bacterium]|nr:type I secretion system permease/ATPase [Alphaproteobacteria bacterium]